MLGYVETGVDKCFVIKGGLFRSSLCVFMSVGVCVCVYVWLLVYSDS